MIHLLPHWNHPGAEGRRIDVWAYSNCEEAELFLNGKSLSRMELTPCGKTARRWERTGAMPRLHAQWQVPYAAGTLTAAGYLAAVSVLLAVGDVLFYAWLKKCGSAIFAKL